MTHYAILDTTAGLLQWIGEASWPHEALEAFWKQQADPDLYGNDECLNIYELTADEAAEVEEWWDNGGESHEVPECLRKVRS